MTSHKRYRMDATVRLQHTVTRVLAGAATTLVVVFVSMPAPAYAPPNPGSSFYDGAVLDTAQVVDAGERCPILPLSDTDGLIVCR